MTDIRHPRTVDASLTAPVGPAVKLDLCNLPLPFQVIPKSTDSLRECALHQIRGLIARSQSGAALSAEEEDALDDGFVLCDLGVVQRKLHAWRKLFPRIKPFFALKCNPDKMVAAVLGQHNGEAGYDCASIAEIKLALQSTGGNPRRCVYANPQRAEADLDAALALGVEALTFDDTEELRKVSQAHRKRVRQWEITQKEGQCHENKTSPQPPEMILRILVPDAGSTVPLGEKFGAHPERVAPLTEAALDLCLPVIGVSFHCGSGCHDPNAYGTAIRLAKEAVDTIDSVLTRRFASGNTEPDFSSRCSIVDIGGGYPGLDGAGGDKRRFCGTCSGSSESTIGDGEETASKVADVVTPLVDELFPETSSPVHIISEPGRYFVESAFALCSRIYSTRMEKLGDVPTSREDTRRRHYYIAQGVHGLFKDVLLCGEVFIPISLGVDENNPGSRQNVHAGEDGQGVLFPSTVHGPSGEDFDVVCADCLLPELKVGDWLIFDRMGAYTLSIAARTGSLPVRYVVGEVD